MDQGRTRRPEPAGPRPLTPPEKAHVVLGFDRLYREGFYNDRVVEAVQEGQPFTRSYGDVLEDIEVQDTYLATVSDMDMTDLPEFTDVEEYLDERVFGEAAVNERVFSIRGEHFSFRRGTLAYHLADSLASQMLLGIRLAAALRGRLGKKPPAAGPVLRKSIGDYSDAEREILSRKYVYLPLPAEDDYEDHDEDDD